MSVVKKPLIDEGFFNADELGRIGSAIFWGYAIGRLINGFLADHANLKKFFAVGILLSAVANLIMGSWASYGLWAVLWGLNGWFQGFGAPSAIVSLARWFGAKERGRFYGIWSASHSIGEGLTFVGTATLVSFWGWHAGFIGPGIFCIFVAITVYILMKDRPEALGLPPVAAWQNEEPAPAVQPADPPGERADIQLEILKLPALWIICLASGTMYVTRYAINSWGVFYLQEAKGYSLIQAGSIMGLNTLAGIGGCIAYGFVSDMLFKTRRPPVTLIYGILEVLSLAVIFFAPPRHPILLTAAFTLYGFTLSGLLAVLGGLFAVDIVPKKAAGAAIGLTGVFSYVFAAMQERISGYLIHRGEVIEKVNAINEAGAAVCREIHHYDFSKPILFWVGSSVMSLILATSLWRVKARA
jgi:OPA family sugar phosphate sensor protein UhpC-like MFS transporter